MKKLLLILLLLMTSLTDIIYAQCNGRYQTEIFTSVNVTTINYSDVYNDIRHEMDIYVPDGDTLLSRPVIIYMHGGGLVLGNKNSTDCIDFCESFAKRGYVTVSINYRLSDWFTWFASKQEQYESIIRAVYDSKSAVRYLRKSFELGNNYGIDTSAIFAGGYSAGGVIAIHHAFVDNIIDLPDSLIENDGSIFNLQSSASNIGGIYGLEGDAGNYGYSSKINGVISYAAGIIETSLIDQYDEPLVSVHGSNDPSVNYYCSPVYGNPAVFTICGPGEMHPQANSSGIINDELIFIGVDHDWPQAGHLNPNFTQAVNFTSDFLYPLLPCNIISSINEEITNKKLLKIIDIFGREVNDKQNITLLYIYNDGTVEKKLVIE